MISKEVIHRINKKRHVKIAIVLLMLLTALSIVSVLAEDSDIGTVNTTIMINIHTIRNQ